MARASAACVVVLTLAFLARSPDTGRKALWVSPRFVHHLEDPSTGEHWSVDASWQFVSRLLGLSLRDPDNVYGHAFEAGDVVVWDELAVRLRDNQSDVQSKTKKKKKRNIQTLVLPRQTNGDNEPEQPDD